MKYNAAHLLILPAFLLLSISGVEADVLILNNGNKIEGIITKEDNDYIVEFSSGSMKVPVEEVKEVRKTTSDLQLFRSRHEQVEGQGAQAHFELGRWAETKGLRQQAEREYRHAIQRDPDHVQARKALGFTKFNGQWMTEEEKMRKKGYVRYQGEWMTPDVKQARIETEEKREKRQEKIQKLKNQLEASRNKIAELQSRLEDLKYDLQVAQSRPRYRYYPVYLQNRRHHRRKKKQDPHQNLWTRTDNGNTVIVEQTGKGEVWKEVTSSGEKKVIHRPDDGHSVERKSNHSKLLRKHKQNNQTDVELVHPKHHD